MLIFLPLFDQPCFFSFTLKNCCWSDPSPGSGASSLLRFGPCLHIWIIKGHILCCHFGFYVVVLEFVSHTMTWTSNRVNVLCVSLRACCVVFTGILNLRLGSWPTWNCNCAVMHSLLIKSNPNLLVKWYMKCFIYWTADLKSSKPWSSRLWTQFEQLRIEAWKS